MDKKTAQRFDLMSKFIRFDATNKQCEAAAHEVNVYEAAHGFGFADDYDEYDYECWADSDEGLRERYDKECEALDKWHDACDELCNSIVAFTDRQVTFDTARTMVTNPRILKELEEITMGKVA